jgi:hypothetical protein
MKILDRLIFTIHVRKEKSIFISAKSIFISFYTKCPPILTKNVQGVNCKEG